MHNAHVQETGAWVRGPKKANLENVPLQKIVKATERGIVIERPVGGLPGPATITKKVIVNIPVDEKNNE